MSRFSGLAAALSTVADKLKADRTMAMETEQKRGLLGYAGMAEGKLTPTQETEGSFEIPGMGRVRPISSIADQISKIKLEREKPQGYEDDLNSAVSAINSGKDAEAVYQRIASKHPYKSAELKRILLPSSREDMADIIRAARGE